MKKRDLVIIGGGAAFFFPWLFIPLKSFLDIFFSLTMLGVGLVLNPNDFINIFKNYKVVLTIQQSP